MFLFGLNGTRLLMAAAVTESGRGRIISCRLNVVLV